MEPLASAPRLILGWHLGSGLVQVLAPGPLHNGVLQSMCFSLGVRKFGVCLAEGACMTSPQ